MRWAYGGLEIAFESALLSVELPTSRYFSVARFPRFFRLSVSWYVMISGTLEQLVLVEAMCPSCSICPVSYRLLLKSFKL